MGSPNVQCVELDIYDFALMEAGSFSTDAIVPVVINDSELAWGAGAVARRKTRRAEGKDWRAYQVSSSVGGQPQTE